MPTKTRCLDPYPVLVATASCMAAMGVTLPALRAGERAAATVTPVPTTRPTMTVRAVKTMPPAGMAMPRVPRRALSPAATATPSARPTAEASSPTATASASIADRT